MLLYHTALRRGRSTAGVHIVCDPCRSAVDICFVTSHAYPSIARPPLPCVPASSPALQILAALAHRTRAPASGCILSVLVRR